MSLGPSHDPRRGVLVGEGEAVLSVRHDPAQDRVNTGEVRPAEGTIEPQVVSRLMGEMEQ